MIFYIFEAMFAVHEEVVNSILESMAEAYWAAEYEACFTPEGDLR